MRECARVRVCDRAVYAGACAWSRGGQRLITVFLYCSPHCDLKRDLSLNQNCCHFPSRGDRHTLSCLASYVNAGEFETSKCFTHWATSSGPQPLCWLLYVNIAQARAILKKGTSAQLRNAPTGLDHWQACGILSWLLIDGQWHSGAGDLGPCKQTPWASHKEASQWQHSPHGHCMQVPSPSPCPNCLDCRLQESSEINPSSPTWF